MYHFDAYYITTARKCFSSRAVLRFFIVLFYKYKQSFINIKILEHVFNTF